VNETWRAEMPGSSDSLASQSLSMRAAPDVDVQRDWEERELTHAIQLGIKKLTQFLNDFGAPQCRNRNSI